MRTNVVGFNEVVRAVLSHLSPSAVVAALSSETVDHPRQALAAYAASKAALEASIRGGASNTRDCGSAVSVSGRPSRPSSATSSTAMSSARPSING